MPASNPQRFRADRLQLWSGLSGRRPDCGEERLCLWGLWSQPAWGRGRIRRDSGSLRSVRSCVTSQGERGIPQSRQGSKGALSAPPEGNQLTQKVLHSRIAPRLQHYTEKSSHGVGSFIIGFTILGFLLYNFIETTCKAVDFIWYLEQLMKKISGVIHIVLDNAKIYKCKKVNEFLEKHKRIKLHYLSPYAQDINPIELFNNALKSNIRHQKAMNAEELKEYAIGFMNKKGSDKEHVKKFFDGKEVKYTKSA